VPSERAPQQTAPSGAVQSAALPGPTEPAARKLRGVPIVVDTATLMLNGELIHLDGITGQGGAQGNQLARYIAGRPVACEPAASGAAKFRCKVGDYDLGEVILLNGAARATENQTNRRAFAAANNAADDGAYGRSFDATLQHLCPGRRARPTTDAQQS